LAFVSNVRGPKSDINVTPLVDVVLVLLIIFMVVTPLLHRGKKVTLPVAKNAMEEKPGQGPVVVSLPPDKTLWWGNTQVGLDELAVKVREELVKARDTKILIKADDSLTVGDVRPALEKVRGAGAKDIVLAAETNANGNGKGKAPVAPR
jgi:biopolymer transport protein TolR